MRKQCQAHAEKTASRCQKKAMTGSRYCFWHQSWGTNLLGAVLMLIAGAALSPVAQTLWDACFPSASFKLLRDITTDKPSLELFLNGVKATTNSTIVIPKSGELEMIVSNEGNGTTDQLMVDIFTPKSGVSILAGGSWRQQAPRINDRNGKLVNNENWLPWTIVADIAIPGGGSKFITPSIHLERTGPDKVFPIIVAASAKQAKRQEFFVFLRWE